MPKISIIIPVYNAEKYLEMTLNSVRTQTFTDYEVICMNDGSTDNSLQILKKYAEQDRRFKIYNQSNAGGSVARNNALKKATGKYIAFLDNDDVYHPNYLERLYENIEKYGADVSCCSYIRFEGDGNYKFNERENTEKHLFVSENPFIDKFRRKKKVETLMWTKLYKKELLEDIKFSEKLPAINDILFNIEVLLKAKKLVQIKEKLIAYRIIPTSQTMKKLTLNRLEEYRNLAIELKQLSKRYEKYNNIIEKITANYIYGMYVTEVKDKYKIADEPELYKKIAQNIAALKEQKIFNPQKLKLSRQIQLFFFLRKIKKTNEAE